MQRRGFLKAGLMVSSMAFPYINAVARNVQSQKSSAMHPLLKDLFERKNLSVLWLGNNSWLIHHKGLLMATDIDLASGYRIEPSPIKAEDIAPHLDFHFMTHGHSDHCNEKMNQVFNKNGQCIFVVPENCYEKVRSWGIEEQRIRIVRPEETLSFPNLKVDAIRALHGDRHFAVAEFANFSDCGYVFEIAGKRILQPGDSVLLAQHLNLEDIDVLFVSPTEHNMHIKHSMILIKQLNPDHIFPQHHGTNVVTNESAFWSEGFPDELYQNLEPEHQKLFHKLRIGEIFEINVKP